MVQPAPAVRGAPVLVPVAPPGVKLFAIGHEMANGVHEAGALPGQHMRHLDRRMAHYIQKLLMAPHIVLQRRDIQIAHQHGTVGRAEGGEMVCGFCNEIQFMGEFRILHTVGNIPAGGHIEIMQVDRAGGGGNAHLHMAAIVLRAPIGCIRHGGQRQAG